MFSGELTRKGSSWQDFFRREGNVIVGEEKTVRKKRMKERTRKENLFTKRITLGGGFSRRGKGRKKMLVTDLNTRESPKWREERLKFLVDGTITLRNWGVLSVKKTRTPHLKSAVNPLRRTRGGRSRKNLSG